MSPRFPLAAVVVAGACAAACATAGVERAYTALDSAGARKRTAFFADTSAIFCDADYLEAAAPT